jgi:hypothetical protein
MTHVAALLRRSLLPSSKPSWDADTCMLRNAVAQLSQAQRPGQRVTPVMRGPVDSR